jgi:peptide chain release factor 1
MIPLEKLHEIKHRHAEVSDLLARPDVATDPSQMAELGREMSRLGEVVSLIDAYEAVIRERAELRQMVITDEDPDLTAMAREELASAEERFEDLEARLRVALIPRDPEDSRDAIVEIRAGTGGDEASLFAGDLFRLYTRFAERNGWRTEVIDATDGAVGGFKEIIFSLKGADAFGTMKYERGVHRVQRVPATESGGRTHTSAATVAVLPEAEAVDVQINMNDLQIDVYRSSGPGGQSVNTTDSAVRITHRPTGLVVTCQDEKSQLKNKEKALRVLRSRLYQAERDRIDSERSQARKSQVGSGDRSEKIRTYNYPQNRVTDHRLEGDDKNHPLQSVMEGDLGGIVEALRMAEHAERLAGD